MTYAAVLPQTTEFGTTSNVYCRWPRRGARGAERLSIGSRMTTQAATFLALPEGSDLGIPVRAGTPFEYQVADGAWVADIEADTARTGDVAHARPKTSPRDRLRAALRAHRVK